MTNRSLYTVVADVLASYTDEELRAQCVGLPQEVTRDEMLDALTSRLERSTLNATDTDTIG